MPRRPSLAAFLPLLALAACRSLAPEPADVRPLAALESVPVTYEARLRGTLEGAGEHEMAEAVDRDLARPTVDLRCTIVEIDGAVATRLLGADRPAPSAWRASRADAEAAIEGLLRAGAIDLTSTPRLHLFDGQRGYLSLLSQQAYVGDFELVADGSTLVADPVVETFQEGLVLDARPTITGREGTILVDVALTTSDADRPIAEVRSRLPGGTAPVTIQTPIVRTQRLAAQAALGAGECLVLRGYSWTQPDRALLVFVTADEGPHAVETAGGGMRPAPVSASKRVEFAVF